MKKKKDLQFHFYFYILMVFIVDIIFKNVRKDHRIDSNYIFFFFIIISYLYFYYFFKENFSEKMYKKIWFWVFILFLAISFIFQIQNNFTQFSPVTIVLLPLFYIFGSMGWFAYILNQKIEGQIFNKMAFWISSGLLIWGVFFLFRGLPMYYFNKADPVFLVEISKVFTIINIITYLLFFRSLFCKE
ncbi:hypothetical protein [Chryseobacterium sp.]|uniref:hypothetical protein n=1 Tax=Chryseobacterium sp. TaxID=1871047 RepID=UPI00321B9DE9